MVPKNLQYRFSIEPITSERLGLCDWKFGLIAASGSGTAEQQARARNLAIRTAMALGDVYVLKLSGRIGKAVPWPAGVVPAERERWMEEQQEIHLAYARVAQLMRLRRMPLDLVSLDPEIVLAIRQAERLRAAALRSIGLEPLEVAMMFPVPVVDQGGSPKRH